MLFRGLNVVIAGDYDEAGAMFDNNIAKQLKGVANKVIVLNWESKAKKDGFTLHQGFDLSDYFAWKNLKK